MGNGQVSSFRWQPERQLTWREKYIFEHSERMRLVAALAQANKKLEKYEQALGYRIPR